MAEKTNDKPTEKNPPKPAQAVYITLPLSDIQADKELPGDLYLCIAHKMLKYKSKGDIFDTEGLDKLLINNVRYFFMDENDRKPFLAWIKALNDQEAAEIKAATPPEAAAIVDQVVEVRRAAMDIFSAARGEPQVKTAVESSKKMVGEFLKKPYAINNISLLNRYGKGTVDHSVNVSSLAVFLGLRMGYTHQIILENLAMGGLFHDIGKVLIPKTSEGMISADEESMKDHPKLGKEFLEKMKEKIPNEVLMIVSHHHEFLDGSGYPVGLKGLAVYDLARIVTIANEYDNLITQSKLENMKDRCAEALDKLESAEFEGKLDPKKVEKIVKILRYSLI